MNVILPLQSPRPPIWLLFVLTSSLLLASPIHDHGDESQTVAEQTESSPSTEAAENSPLIEPDSFLYNAIKYTGKFHLMALHFPISFLLAGALVQWYRVIRGKGDSIVSTLLWFGAIGAIAAAALGWMYAYDSVYFGEEDIKLLSWHRWLGTGTAALALLVLLLRNKLGPKSLAIALTLCAGLVAAAAHFGASLVYGPDFLMEF